MRRVEQVEVNRYVSVATLPLGVCVAGDCNEKSGILGSFFFF